MSQNERKKAKKSVERKIYTKEALKTNPLNVKKPMRGGIRLT